MSGASAQPRPGGSVPPAPPPRVVILCGGRGTRLQEETEFRPKPMVQVGPLPLLWHIMRIYASQGFSSFVLALG